MAAFTLVHGSPQNSSAWNDVAEILRARGHEVSTPDLPKKEPWSLARYAEVIAEQLANARPQVVVAHSFNGVFLPLLASQADVLVFEAAVIPEPGKSVREQFVADPTMFSREWVGSGPRWFQAEHFEELARQFLFHDCADERMPSLLETIEIFDTRHLVSEPSPLASWPDVRSISVIPTGDRTLTPEWMRKASERVGAEKIEIPGGHCPHSSRPDELARILLSTID